MNDKLPKLIYNPYTIIAFLFLIIVITLAVIQYGKGKPVATNASSVNNLAWDLTEPEITISSKIYRTTTNFLEDPDDQYLIATVAAPAVTYDDTAVLPDVTYYYSIFQVDDTGLTFDPIYDALIPVTTTTTGGGSSGGGGGGGGSTRPPVTPPASGGVRLVNSNGTFFFIDGGYRKGITSPGIMYACGFEFKDAKLASNADMSLPSKLLLPCTGSLVKSVEDKTVYLISKNQRHAFVSAKVFTDLGFKFSSVLAVTNPELQALPQGDNLSNGSAAHLPGADINVNGTVYWIDDNLVKHPYPSQDVWNSWHRDGDFTTVVPANANDLNLTTGANVPTRF